ncbi:MAG TPA: fructosamine kinase family protein [Stellaceae bacterium]
MSLLPEAARAAVEAAAGAPVVRVTPLGGGCVATVIKADLADGGAVVAKVGASGAAAGGALAVEAFMLGWLRGRGLSPVPAVLHGTDDLLVMEWIDGAAGTPPPEAARDLADVAAAWHEVTAERFGFARDTVIAALPQPNAEADDWRDFFRDRRLLHMAGAAHAAGRLPAATLRRIERLAGRLDAWDLGGTRPSLVHGDLWGGNVLSRGGRIVGLIDPAIYFADAEIELAFMTLFGTVGDAFFDRYAERRPLRPGFFEVRRDLYNLYPLLVHVRLFGGHYVGQVERILARFAG